ncbi:MutS-related protein [Aquimarina longa]|uniref:MutS-related protein n=1 Tax=Aquimarina longa TaxID=1080221 RepID=UPI0007844505|nr:hypothetical protein [Aquimarina longa]
MSATKDLHIKKELLPLFDYTINLYARNRLLKILKTPLISEKESIQRQNILKGFIENGVVLNGYSYPILYLREVYEFLNSYTLQELPKKKLKYRIQTSKKDKAILKSRFAQLILLFHRLEVFYFSRINTTCFPESYQCKLKEIMDFFESFSLSDYEKLIRESSLKDTHIIELSEIVLKKESKGAIALFWDNLFQFEAYLSISKGIIERNFIFPQFSVNSLSVDNFFHPLLKKPVVNSFKTSNTVILLTGPNMSGKSTFLKAISICMYLGQIGIAIPASKAEIPFFKTISVALHHRDDILSGYSHFMTEIVNLKNVVNQARKEEKCFAVFDELFSGTNEEDAFEICTATIKGLSKFKNSIFFISTHIQRLQKSATIPGVSSYYIDCEFVNKLPKFTYKIKEDWSELKIGKILFEKEGLSDMLT